MFKFERQKRAPGDARSGERSALGARRSIDYWPIKYAVRVKRRASSQSRRLVGFTATLTIYCEVVRQTVDSLTVNINQEFIDSD
jgi:hypothetical protein